jgi:hypothetical protein
MSEQAAEQPGGEQGSLNLGISHSADAPVSEPEVSEPSMSEPSLSEPSLSEPVAAASPASEAPKIEAVKAEPVADKSSAQSRQPEASGDKISQIPSKVIVMSRENRGWTDHGIHADPEPAEQPASVFGMRRIAAIAAVLALATTAGAVGGALATASLMHGTSNVASNASPTSPLETSLSRIDSDIQSLKTGLDHTSKLGMNQFNKTTERLDKLERAQAEPAAKLAKLSEAIDRLHALPVPPPAVAAAAPAASKEVTGSIPATPSQQQASAGPSAQQAAALPPKSEVGRLPTVDGWVLRDVAYGSALIDGRRGTYEVFAGDMIPGLGRVDAIRRQDGRWVVVTSRGLIVAR